MDGAKRGAPVKRSWRLIRQLVVPAGLLAVAVGLTVPWTLWVIAETYQRNIVENATGIARRIESQIRMAGGPTEAEAQIKALQQFLDALHAEMFANETVERVIYGTTTRFPDVLMLSLTRSKSAQAPLPRWTPDQIRQFVTAGVVTSRDEGVHKLVVWIVRYLLNRPKPSTEGNYVVSVPWVQNDQVLGFTYIEMSRDALRRQFWRKEGPLLKRVTQWTAGAVLVLSALILFAYRMWGNVGRVRQTAELSEAGLKAERGLTAAVLAHEIRNPLAALVFQIHSLRRNAADPARVTAIADTVESELKRIEQLVKDYLAHEKGQFLRSGPVDLCDAVRRFQSLVGEMLRQRNTRLVVVTPPRPVAVTCDPHALRQVLLNLVINAQQAMGSGGTITVTVSHAEGFGTLSVSDTGPGIPPEMTDRLFKPFQTSKREGSGIGLALVKRFVDNFGGNVSVESHPGRGATFHLRLPLAGGGGVIQ